MLSPYESPTFQADQEALTSLGQYNESALEVKERILERLILAPGELWSAQLPDDCQLGEFLEPNVTIILSSRHSNVAQDLFIGMVGHLKIPADAAPLGSSNRRCEINYALQFDLTDQISANSHMTINRLGLADPSPSQGESFGKLGNMKTKKQSMQWGFFQRELNDTAFTHCRLPLIGLDLYFLSDVLKGSTLER